MFFFLLRIFSQEKKHTMNILVKLCTFLLALAVVSWAPVKAAIDCEALGALDPCVRPGDNLTAGNGTGQFICRRRWVHGYGIYPRVQYQTLCIAKTWGRASDTCGCCNGNCPTPCGELCPNPVGGAAGSIGRYVYDWYSWWPRRYCVSPGRSLQLQQQNPSRWWCSEYPGWFARVFGSNYDDTGSYSPFGWP